MLCKRASAPISGTSIPLISRIPLMSRIRLLSLAALGASLSWVACGGGGASDEPAAGAEAAAADTPPQFETTEVADGVYQFRWIGHNALFVVTSEGVFAFDPISVEAAATYAEEIRRVAPGAELAAIVYSHNHADHATGAEVLREAFGADVPIYAHRNADAPLREAANPDLPPPTDTFDETMTLAGGEIELHYLGRSHSDDIAVGFLLSALHISGLATLTHTPSPMRFLREILERPPNERAYVLIPVGYPAEDAKAPLIEKKPLAEIVVRR